MKYAHLIFASNSAEGRIIDDVRHGFQVLADHPVLEGFELHHIVCGIAALERVPVDRTDRTEIRANLCSNVGWKRYQRDPLENFLTIPVIVRIVVKDQIDDRQAS